MDTRAGVGYSEDTNSYQAGLEAAEAAISDAGIDQCDLALVFATSRHDAALLIRGVREKVGPQARIAGGCGVGVISNDRLGYDGSQVGVAVISSGSFRATVCAEEGVGGGPERVGKALGEQLKRAGFDPASPVVLMYDAVRRPQDEGLALNPATPLLAGMFEALGGWPTMAGCGLLGDQAFNRTQQWVDDRLLSQSAIALMLSGDVRMDTVTLHGLRPMTSYHTVTAVDGDTVLEIDRRPALSLIDDLIGSGSAHPWEEFPFLLVLGVNTGDRFGEFREQDYVNQLCIGVDRERGALVMAEPFLKAGDDVQIMRRGIDFSYIRERVANLFGAVADRRPFLALYIDCAGRTSLASGTEEEEAAEVQRAIAGRVPLLGMYSAVEIASVGGAVRAQNWTGVLSLFSQ